VGVDVTKQQSGEHVLLRDLALRAQLEDDTLEATGEARRNATEDRDERLVVKFQSRPRTAAALGLRPGPV
jgi:hypothetical protein